MEHYY